MTRGWTAQGTCPQCGGKVSLEAGDPVLRCSFCRTGLYMVPDQALRYTLPVTGRADGSSGSRLVFLPYWRFRGARYRVLPTGRIETSVLDTTVLSLEGMESSVEPSLGIRPQAVRLRLVVDSSELIPPVVGPKEGLNRIEQRLRPYEDTRASIERLVGENRCLIYAPFLLETTTGRGTFVLRELFGSGAERPISAPEGFSLVEGLARPPAGNKMRFLPLICPECGCGLPELPGAVAMRCDNCSRAWIVRRGEFIRLNCAILPPPGGKGDCSYLPFWHVALRLDGLPIKNRGELRQRVIPYQPVPERWRREPVQLLIPGFHVNPRHFLKVSKRMSLAPIDLAGGGRPVTGRIEAEPVRLPLEEAAQAVRVILSHLFARQKRIYPLIPGSRPRLTGFRLLYLPFLHQGQDLVDAWSGQALPGNALR